MSVTTYPPIQDHGWYADGDIAWADEIFSPEIEDIIYSEEYHQSADNEYMFGDSEDESEDEDEDDDDI